MHIELSNKTLNRFQLKNQEYLTKNTNYYNLKSGKQEYRLYSYLSTFFNDAYILDIGTLYGLSAVSLSHNEQNHVISYNIVDDIQDPDNIIYNKKNITFKIKNVLEDLNKEFVSKIKIVMIDIDHEGIIEKQIIDRLVELNYNGIIILDDIHIPWNNLKDKMKDLWEHKITLPNKFDITKYGHFSGTGIIILDKNIKLILK